MVTPAGVGVPESSEALDSDEQILSLDLPRAQCHTVFKGGGGQQQIAVPVWDSTGTC